MYIQRCVKGIGGLSWRKAQQIVSSGDGILCRKWLSQKSITPAECRRELTSANLDRHLHDYTNYGPQTPFISLAAGCVERDVLLRTNWVHSAVDTALFFATDRWSRPGALFYLWAPVGLNRAVEVEGVAEAVRELNVYQAWSPYQLEGEIAAKVEIRANQIERVEWWDGSHSKSAPQYTFTNPDFTDPAPLTMLRELF